MGLQRYGLRAATAAPRRVWLATAASGLVAAGAMGLIVDGVAGSMATVGALVGVPTVAAGWLVHLLVGVVLAFVFVAALLCSSLRAADPRTVVVAGIGYGVLLEAVAGGVVFPLWAGAVGVPHPVPDWTALGLAAHVTYGTVLGALAVASLAVSKVGRPRRGPRAAAD